MLIIIGFLFSVFISVIASIVMNMTVSDAGYGVLLDFPSVLLTLVFLFFFFLTSKSGSIIGRYIRSSFKKNYAYTRTELVSLSTAIKNTIKITLAAGGFGFLFGAIGALMFLGNPEQLGPLAALSLYTVLYAIIVSYVIFFPVQAWAENKINAMEE
jgi:flagellar motor component MotA